mmetsp:Transcript_12390/g.31709  ORF Transcript_12390/g.31709 Transcript_12390/m.31709 type:complete len:223 (-) Transcript_12390:508-1176(-)
MHLSLSYVFKFNLRRSPRNAKRVSLLRSMNWGLRARTRTRIEFEECAMEKWLDVSAIRQSQLGNGASDLLRGRGAGRGTSDARVCDRDRGRLSSDRRLRRRGGATGAPAAADAGRHNMEGALVRRKTPAGDSCQSGDPISTPLSPDPLRDRVVRASEVVGMSREVDLGGGGGIMFSGNGGTPGSGPRPGDGGGARSSSRHPTGGAGAHEADVECDRGRCPEA